MEFDENIIKNQSKNLEFLRQIVNSIIISLWSCLARLLKLAIEYSRKMVSREENSSNSHFYFNKLPDVVHRSIFDYLDVADRLRLRTVCSLWNEKLERSLHSINQLTVVYVEPLCPLVNARSFYLNYRLDGEYFYVAKMEKRLIRLNGEWINQVNDHRHIIVLDGRHLKKKPHESLNAFTQMLVSYFGGKLTKLTLCMPILNGAVLPKASDPDPVRKSSAQLLDDLTEKVIDVISESLPAHTQFWQSVWSDRVNPGSHKTVHEPLHRFLPATMNLRRP